MTLATSWQAHEKLLCSNNKYSTNIFIFVFFLDIGERLNIFFDTHRQKIFLQLKNILRPTVFICIEQIY
jgi:hypothetical protein